MKVATVKMMIDGDNGWSLLLILNGNMIMVSTRPAELAELSMTAAILKKLSMSA